MGNNVLPARAGDAIRVVLMAPRARDAPSAPCVGTLLAERLLDVAVLLVIFVVVGYGLLGEVGGDSVELIALVAIVGVRRGRPSAGASCAATSAARAAGADRVGHARPAARAPRAAAARR